MTKFTKERLEEIAFGDSEHDAEKVEMARQLLASMGQEPIAALNSMTSENGGLPYGAIQFLRMPKGEERPGLLKPYAAPQLPQPALGDGRDQFEEWFKFHYGDEQSIVKLHRANGGANYSDQYVDLAWIAWKDSRAAMLQSAEPPAYEIKRFGDFSVRSLDLEYGEISTSIQCFHFERGTVPDHLLNQGMVEKYALQAIINALQQKCDGMDDAPIPQIWPAQQEVK